MSGSIRRSLGPARRYLEDCLAKHPDVRTEFDSSQAREEHLRQWKVYKDSLNIKAQRFSNLHTQLISLNLEDDNEKGIVEELVEKDAEILSRYDDVLAMVVSTISELEEQRDSERSTPSVSFGEPGVVPARGPAQESIQLNESGPSPSPSNELDPTPVSQPAPIVARSDHQGTAIVPRTVPGIRLPKIELVKFSGKVTQWKEFWDTFETSVHLNASLSAIEKMHYLRSLLSGDAKTTISGISSTSENYDVAIRMLRERFGKDQSIIHAHYMALNQLPAAGNQTAKLRSLFDSIETHMNSLEALEETVENRQNVSLIMSKLPSEVVFRLEEIHDGEVWTVKDLRTRLKKYLAAREAADQQSGATGSHQQKSRPEALIPSKFPSYSQRDQSTASTLFSSSNKGWKQRPARACAFCGKSHWSDECSEYPTLDMRKQKIKGHCFGCLKKGHSIKECQYVRPCYHCKQERNHHRSLCPKKFGRMEASAVASDVATAVVGSPTAGNTLMASGESVLLQTARTIVQGSNRSHAREATILLDCGSHRSYISSKLAKELWLKQRDKDKLPVFTFGSRTPTQIDTATVDMKIQLIDGSYFQLSANVVPTITGGIQRAPVDPKKLSPLIQKIPLAHSIPTSQENLEIDLLIGNDYYCDLVTNEKMELSPGLHLLGSKLGFILTGRYGSKGEIGGRVNSSPAHTMFIMGASSDQTSLLSLVPIDDQLIGKLDVKSFWNLETLGIKEHKEDATDEDAVQQFDSSIMYQEQRYYVKWPWREKEIDLPTNYQLAMGRLKSLMNRYKDQPGVLQEYQSVLNGQLQNGIVETVTTRTESEDSRVHYLPHHAVISPSHATTKLRVVYDGSAKTSKQNKSLNECLERGPVMLEDLASILIRFRLHKVAIAGDIEKAFLQIGLQSEDRDVTRFLWLKDPSKLSLEGNLQTYRFCRIPFGIVSSPFLLWATINHHLRKDSSDVALKVLRDIYVDNIITGVSSPAKALQFYQKVKQLFSQASMNVREWKSNSSEFLSSIAEVDRAGKTGGILGVPWEPETDTISVAIPQNFDRSKGFTKRSLLNFSAAIYDPMGLLSPVVLRTRLLIQKLWELKYDWDQKMSNDLEAEWVLIARDLGQTAPPSIPRFIATDDNQNSVFELHCFCDASARAYGTCIYLRVIGPTGTTTANLVFAKSRVAPVKGATSIPRLELLGAYIGVKCLNFVSNDLSIPINRKVLWTDSQCILHWLNSEKTLTVFVRNRIAEMQKIMGIEYRYIPTEENPADIGSRGCSLSELNTNTLWWKGPQWLSNANENGWPSQAWHPSQASASHEEVEISSAIVVGEGSTKNQKSPSFPIDENRYSSLTKLLRVTAWCFRFSNNAHQKKQTRVFSPLTADELDRARRLWIKEIQRRHFEEVSSAILAGKKHQLKETLDLWIDDDGIIRCGGRLKYADLPLGSRFPVLLPKGSYFTRLIIQDQHKKLFHSGVAHTLSQLRMGYWVPSGRSEVFKVIRSCGMCRKFDGGPYKVPEVPALPKCRVNPSAPFTHTGLDYLGPLYVKNETNSAEPTKIWVCLYTCLATRAIHLEMVQSLSTEDFLLGFQRFISRRGTPKLIISDNASQFKLASTLIESLWSAIPQEESVASYLSANGIHWKFITERAPWRGGFYERLVRFVKQALRKSLGKLRLTVVQLTTVLTQVEAMINSRPLAYVGSDMNSGEVITPAHFLCLNPSTVTASTGPEDDNDPEYLEKISSRDLLLEFWKKGQRHLDHFWKAWRSDYLLSLRERQTRLKQPRCRSDQRPSVGDVVQLQSDGPRGSWKVAKIVKLVLDSDGKCRSAKVQLASGTITQRSLLHLYPLELDIGQLANGPMEHEPPKEEADKPVESESKRATREAAKGAIQKIQQVLAYEEME